MIRRLIRSVLTWPDARAWWQCLMIGILTLALIGLVAGLSDMLQWQPRPQDWGLRLLSVMCVPALTEELFFRGLMVPDNSETRRPALWISLAICVFIGWHVFEALVLLPGAHMFLKPAFLTGAGLLGICCAIMRYHTGSIWPAVILHGLVVWTWQVFFGGPDIAQLLGQAAHI